jgi:multidrug efflux pump subunit AcrB
MNLTVTFEVGTDVDMSQVLVQNRVAIAEPLLPEDVRRQGVKTEKKSTNLTIMVNLISPDDRYDELYLSNYINLYIKDILARVPGVGSVTVFGAKDFGMGKTQSTQSDDAGCAGCHPGAECSGGRRSDWRLPGTGRAGF